MSKYYTRLKLEVSDMVDISLIRYDVTVTYKSLSAKPTSSKPHSLGKNRRFSSNGLSEKHNLSNRGVEEVRYYIKDIKGKLIKDITANPLSKDGRASRYKLKTTPASLKRDPKNNKIVGIDTTEVGWIIIEKQYSIESFLKKIYKDKPTAKEENIFRSNNPHLTGTPVLSLQPGDFVILSNTSNNNNKELAKIKKDAKAAKLEFDKVKKELGFNSETFASNADFLHDMLRTADYVALTKDKVKSADKPSKGTNYAAIAAGASQGIVTFSEISNAKVTEAYRKLVKAYEEARKITYDSSGKPVKSKLGNPKKFNSFRQNYPKLIKDFDNAFSQSFFKYETGLTADNIRKQIRNDVVIRSSRYKGGISAYVSNFKKLGKMTKMTEGGGNILVALSAYDATINVKNAYNKGDSENTRKTIITETLKLEGSLAGGWAGGAAGAALATVLIGASTGGVGLIVIGVVAAGGGLAGGYWGGEAGSMLADVINEGM